MSQRKVHENSPDLRPFWYTLVALDLTLAAGGAVYAEIHAIPLEAAIPVVAAFLIQASVYLVPALPRSRLWVESRIPRPRLAFLLVLLSVAPYITYSIPGGVFSWIALLKLLLLTTAVSHLYVVAPPRDQRLCWQDVVVLLLLAYPMVSGLSPVFREIYLSPHPEIPPLDALGKLMLIPLGASTFLSIRRLEGTGYQLPWSTVECKAGLKYYLLFLPAGAALAVGIGFVTWEPRLPANWFFPLELLANIVGVYAVVALAEELYFRGVLQNLLTARFGRPELMIAVVGALFGLAHLGRGWRYAAVAAVAGLFYGRAYQQTRSVVASSVTHTLVVITKRYFFA